MTPVTLDITPAELDLNLYAGDDANIKIKLWQDVAMTTPLPLTGYTGWKAQIRNRRRDTVEAANFTIDSTQQASSIIILFLSGADISTLRSEGPRWDLQVTDPTGHVFTILQGNVTTFWDATR